MAQFARGPQARATAQSLNAPHAALLIDFDNVTMGIRSDLTKELRNLLNSDIIKGKVAVQRAYADWRRYPQYIVSLAENSVDLIFAPAYGSSKKNATDIRLAIDALELVFTRPEIGTFILLSGDSDFSSLVLKLKEYGKYVIGVGIRESSSDLLVQNCDEYYSYSGLTGLTRAGDETVQAASDDPWELVAIAVRQMHEQKDVMRSDRLKQILLQLDPNFDEKALGFPKFNRFLQEAANRGALSLRKMENGQFEVAPAQPAEPEVAAAAPAAVVVPAPAVEPEPSAGRREPGRGRDRGRAATPPVVPETVAEAPPAEEPGPAPISDLRGAYDLLRRVTADLAKARGMAIRDSDVKRRMLEVSPGFDEGRFGFSKFSRFLRQAHDENVIDLHRVENGTYEVSPAGRELPSPAAAAPEEPRGRERERARQRRDREARPSEAPTEEPVVVAAAAPVAAEVESREPAPAAEPEKRPSEPVRVEREERPAAAVAATVEVPRPSVAIGFRRGSRRGLAPVAPPPILEGQSIPVGGVVEPVVVAAAVETAPHVAVEGDGRGAKPEDKAARGRVARKREAPLAGLELPTEPAAIIARLTGYAGVGRKTAEAAVDAFGAEVFQIMQERPEQLREKIGDRRAAALLKGWQAETGAADGKKRSRGGARKKAGRGEQIEAFEAQATRPAARRSGAKRAAKKTARKRSRAGSARTAKAGGSKE